MSAPELPFEVEKAEGWLEEAKRLRDVYNRLVREMSKLESEINQVEHCVSNARALGDTRKNREMLLAKVSDLMAEVTHSGPPQVKGNLAPTAGPAPVSEVGTKAKPGK